ncbi:glycosyltransferase family 87 protein [Halobacterium salinarum]|uniref:DUF2029 family protein n=3 Tax=Halobacterium salinarum TaxID=2242 RepID=Q9HN16_HALSA|nr:glycosyltransferase family 87 protein [Halobacterium salinarum]AAG20405.1 hypothetical protein VNG_2292H [Halobacterium salinarum NRC-1]MBB6089669.1 hypothetical protein [Halobacterium salinarum]MDL0119849.1 glycosyltransferase family 87 protein [Halobacterium salinarum]MDL0130342.1 glycosyltransferase family 87 protein [Halobacterium salinarum]MDL0142510.1 glycosyltransferase family 87 protein [Halobacterium salinarum]
MSRTLRLSAIRPSWLPAGLDARRLVLFWSAVAGVLVPVYFLVLADVSHLAWDYRAYHAAAEAALHGDPFVGIETGLPGVSYVYPPVAVALFVPQAAAGGWQTAFAIQSACNVAAALGLAALTVHTIEARRGRLDDIDRLLVVGFCVASAPVLSALGLGQVDTLIALALAGTFVALERDHQGIAGVVIAAAALVKVFPVVLGLWLVFRRAWHAIGVAVATATGALVAGGLWFGVDAYIRYVHVLAARSRVSEFAGTVSPDFFAMSLYRPLSQLLGTVDPRLYGPLALLAVAPAVWFVARREHTLTDRLTTYLAVVAGMLLVSPASNALYVVYAYFPLVCLLYLDPGGRERWLLLAGTAAMAFPVQPAHVAAGLASLGAPSTASHAVLAVVAPVLSVASVPLLGLSAVLVWCTIHTAGRHVPLTTAHTAASGD